MGDTIRQIAPLLSHALDWIKSNLRTPEDFHIAIYIGRKNDPSTGIVLGNCEAPELHAKVGYLLLDGTRVGTVIDGEVRMDKPN